LALLLALAKALYDAGAGAWTDGVLAAGGGVAPGPDLTARLQIGLTGVVPVVLGVILFVPLAVWLMRRLPRAWPLVVGGALTAVILTVGWLPYALGAGPQLPSLPQGPLRTALAPLVAAAELPAPDIFADPSPGSLTDVTGGLAGARVVIGDDAASDTPAEARAYLGHLIGHYAHADILIVTLLLAATLTLGAFAIQRFAAPLARLIGDREAKAPHAPAALPAVAMLAILTVVAAEFTGAAYLRWANVRADAYSLELAREPEGLASVLVKDWNHTSVDPNPLAEALFYTHPPLKGRLVQAMTWETSRE
jgi:STE24 endopeptidase